MKNRERRYQLVGWVLFVVCALFFATSAALSGDVLTLVGSIVFLIACIAFIIPLTSRELRRSKDTGRDCDVDTR